ncbi:cell surface protein [Listeria floridensis FSL S10-1187]|uniref:Cell surface protein n=1 Tax=Listeria floridensis FSL S10-1187 TaxID=1265817 RepID=A0ABN0RCI8_9LIST|nr:WxL domain-containing protein [Listeria floridensis]EUJ27204.1 cell surface protein [Listeria floridensis FSL S10-1187]
MKAGKFFTLAMLAMMFFFAGTQTVLAAGDSSDSSVQFVGDDDGTTQPVNPVDPTEEVNPTDPVTPTSGALRIDFASNISFGTQKIYGKDTTYHPLYTQVKPVSDGTITKYVPQYVQITDNTGLNQGWELMVSGTEFKSTSDKVLTGAELILSGTTVNSKMDQKFKPSLINSRVAIGSTPESVVTASANEGMSVWTVAFGDAEGLNSSSFNSNISLHVPAETVKVAGETYTSTLTWTLSSAP